MHQVQKLQTVALSHEPLLLFHSNQFIKTRQLVRLKHQMFQTGVLKQT